MIELQGQTFDPRAVARALGLPSDARRSQIADALATVTVDQTFLVRVRMAHDAIRAEARRTKIERAIPAPSPSDPVMFQPNRKKSLCGENGPSAARSALAPAHEDGGGR